jgi:hypothetical protein
MADTPFAKTLGLMKARSLDAAQRNPGSSFVGINIGEYSSNALRCIAATLASIHLASHERKELHCFPISS